MLAFLILQLTKALSEDLFKLVGKISSLCDEIVIKIGCLCVLEGGFKVDGAHHCHKLVLSVNVCVHFINLTKQVDDAIQVLPLIRADRVLRLVLHQV